MKKSTTNSAYTQEWNKHKFQTDPKYREIHSIYGAIYRAINYDKIKARDKYSSGSTFIKRLGCTPLEFRAHLEKQFKNGWSWDNYGKLWEVNHKHSLIDAFVAGGIEAMKSASHYLNCEPCDKLANRSSKKGKKHTTNDRFMKADPNVVLHQDATSLTISIVGSSKFESIIIDPEHLALLSNSRISFFKPNSKNPCIYYRTAGKSLAWRKHLFGNDLYYRKTSGAPNDFRKECYTFITKEMRNTERRIMNTRWATNNPEKKKEVDKRWQRRNYLNKKLRKEFEGWNK